MSRLAEPRVNILGVGVSAISMDEAVQRSSRLLETSETGYICVTGVHGVMEAQSDINLKRILNESFLTTPDGVPTVWLGRWHGHSNITRVYGPDLMLALCRHGVAQGYRHFLFGGKAGVAEQLKASLENRCPGVKIVGTYTPPFRPLAKAEERELIEQLASTRTDVFWVGLSTPKQERFMSAYSGLLPVQLMVGVGAAFDLLSGSLSEAPDWMKTSGLQWLYRLIKEPRRLWRRYLTNNPAFIVLTCLQLARLRKYDCGVGRKPASDGSKGDAATETVSDGMLGAGGKSVELG